MSVWGVVVAAGSGTRYGSVKQFQTLGGVTLLDRALAVAAKVCDHVVAVVPEDALGRPCSTPLVIAGGATRSDSVRAGLTLVGDAEVIVVHDAARPLAPETLFVAVIDAVRNGADAAVPGLPVTDTIKQVDRARVVATLDRATLVRVQTPQAFRADALRAAHAGCPEATDDAALVEANGGAVVVVPGHEAAIKVTTPEDLARLELRFL